MYANRIPETPDLFVGIGFCHRLWYGRFLSCPYTDGIVCRYTPGPWEVLHFGKG